MAFRNPRVLISVTPALVVLAVALVAFMGSRKIPVAVEAVAHTRDVISSSDELLRYALDGETGVRAYAATSDSVFLDPVRHARDSAHARLEEIRRLTRQNPTQQAHIDALVANLDSVFGNIQEVQSRTAAKSFVATRDGTLLLKGKHLMDSVRGNVRQVQLVESSQLAERRAGLDRYTRYSTLIILLGGALAVVVSLLVNLFLAGILAERDHMTRELTLQLADMEKIQMENARAHST